MHTFFRRCGLAALSVLTLVLTSSASAPLASSAASLTPDRPGLVITYRAALGARLALRTALEKRESSRFAAWKANGVLSGYKLLFSRYVNTDGWDGMAVLTFAGDAALAKWKAVEDASPSGLSPESLKLVAEVHTVPVDAVRDHDAQARSSTGVYLVIPYTYVVSHDEYVGYLDQYVLPQFDGWIAENAVSGYQVFLSRYPAGRPWGSLIFLEYRDDAALGRRDAVTAKVRHRLSDDPRWKALSDNKKAVRNELELTVADDLSLH